MATHRTNTLPAILCQTVPVQIQTRSKSPGATLSFPLRKRVLSHVSTGHVTYINELCVTCEWVMSHTWISHVTHMNEAHIYIGNNCCSTCDISHTRISHVTYTNKSCHTYKWFMSDIWMRHITYMNKSCHTYEWGSYMNRFFSRIVCIYMRVCTYICVCIHIYIHGWWSHVFSWQSK